MANTLPPLMELDGIASLIAALAAAAGVHYTGQSLDAIRDQNEVVEQGQETDRRAQEADQLAGPSTSWTALAPNTFKPAWVRSTP